MLKKINVQDVRLGMFIHELCGNWMDHPFWKKSFKLDSVKDLKALRECGIAEVMIDTQKGLDVKSGLRVAHVQDATSTLQEEAISEKKPERPVALHEELQRAQKIQTKAKRTVGLLFKDARMGDALQVEGVFALVEEIIQSVERNPGALLNLTRLRNRDDHVYLHSVAVGALMIALGRQMGMEGDTLKRLGMAGLLHDIGKMAMSDEVLNKPGKLTDMEFEIIKTHPQCGWEILNSAHEMDEMVLDVCLHHHERIDGTGYPHGISGEEMTQFARMAAVCDVYDAMTSDSCYKKALSPAEAIRRMAEMQSKHFDQTVFHAFVKTVGIYPLGTLVKLKSGRLAVVTDQTTKSLTAPVVKVFFSTKVNEPVFPELVDLSKVPDAIASVENPANWKFDLKAMAGV